MTTGTLQFDQTDDGPRWLLALLTLTICTSFFVQIEPAPTDVLFVGLLGLLTLTQRLYIPRLDKLCWFGFVLFVVGDMFSLTQMQIDPLRGIRFWSISFYLQLSFVVFAGALSRGGSRALVTILRAYYVAALAASLIAILGVLGLLPSAFTMKNMRYCSTFKDPNVLAPFLVPMSLIAAYNILNGRHRLLNSIGLFILGATIAIAFSRAGIINLVCSLGLYVVLRSAMTGDLQRNLAVYVGGGIVALLCIVAGLFLLQQAELMEFMRERMTMQSYDSRRFQVIGEAIQQFAAKPLGLGPGQGEIVFGKQVHSVYVGILSDAGVIGFIGFVLFLFATIYRAFVMAYTSPANREMYIVLFACVVGQAVNSLVINSQHWRHLFLVLALPWGVYRDSIPYIPLGISFRRPSGNA